MVKFSIIKDFIVNEHAIQHTRTLHYDACHIWSIAPEYGTVIYEGNSQQASATMPVRMSESSFKSWRHPLAIQGAGRHGRIRESSAIHLHSSSVDIWFLKHEYSFQYARTVQEAVRYWRELEKKQAVVHKGQHQEISRVSVSMVQGRI